MTFIPPPKSVRMIRVGLFISLREVKTVATAKNSAQAQKHLALCSPATPTLSHTPPPSFPHTPSAVIPTFPPLRRIHIGLCPPAVIPTPLRRHSHTPPPSFPQFPHPSAVIPTPLRRHSIPLRRHSHTPPPHPSAVIPTPLRRHFHTPPPSFPHPSAVIPTPPRCHSRSL